MTMSTDRPPLTDSDKRALAYFHREKGDMSRFVGFDEAAIRRDLPHLWHAMANYRAAKIVLDTEVARMVDDLPEQE